MNHHSDQRLAELNDLMFDIEAYLSGLISGLPDGPIEALEPFQLMCLLSPSLERIRQAQGLLQQPASAICNGDKRARGLSWVAPPHTPHE
jgi:hypothetical protein